MGIQGLAAASGAAWQHGREIAARRPDLVTILIGINDCFGNMRRGGGYPSEEAGRTTGGWVGQIVDQLRVEMPAVPVAVLTPIVTSGAFDGWREGAEALRTQTREAVMARVHAGDRNLVVVEGQALVPPEHMYEGLHPSTQGCVS
jgi:lysophospholipase L1-like esterase